ncbi:unnamed protein product [Musa acuminata var. zebrina]
MEWSSTLSWLMSLLLLICSGNSEEYAVRLSLVGFLQVLSGNDTGIIEKLGWSAATDPCTDGWNGVTCNNRTSSVYKIKLEELGLRGTIDAGRLCQAPSLAAVSLLHNAIRGEIPPEISDCGRLTHLYLGGNSLAGSLPPSLTLLGNLKVLDVSDNDFSGELPDLAKISGLVGFLAQNNRLHGTIPSFRFGNFDRRRFNVSNNLFAGPIPPGGDRLDQTSFIGNPGLCGKPLPVACPPSPSKEDHKSLKLSREKAIMFSGYIALGLVLFLFVTYKLIHKKKTTKHRKISDEKIASDGSSGKSSIPWSSTEASATATSSLIVLKRPGTMTDLKFDDLLKAPAESLGRGRNGSLYKVTMADGTSLAVKRIRDCGTSAAEFRRRMERMDMARHTNVLPAVAFHCSTQEKLVVYEYQRNGSLLSLLQGRQLDCVAFDWSYRLRVAAGVAEGLAAMHRELLADGIGHGNLKSSNILLTNVMDPCISEYGLVADSRSVEKAGGGSAVAAADVHAFGIILLELLTGKPVRNEPSELARWVNSVVREEWTVEVFDEALVSGGASEGGMVQLLQVALRCVHPSPAARPSMDHVAAMVNTVREEEDERSEVSEP